MAYPIRNNWSVIPKAAPEILSKYFRTNFPTDDNERPVVRSNDDILLVNCVRIC